MSEKAGKKQKRVPLDRKKVFQTAVQMADTGGVKAVSMRKIAQRLGVEAMSLYYHVANKEEILDGMVDIVFGEIRLPAENEGWLPAMKRRAHSARETLLRHPWAIGLMDSRTPGEANLTHQNAVLGALRRGGFSVIMAARAFSAIDSFIYGSVMQELSLPFSESEGLDEITANLLKEVSAERFPYITEVAAAHSQTPGFDFSSDFDFGLTLILDALAKYRDEG